MKYFLTIFSFLIPFILVAQVTISPSIFDVDSEITITVDPGSQETNCNRFSNPAKIYIHAGVGDETNAFGVSVIGNWGQDDGVGEMTKNDDGTYSITLVPEVYFNLTEEEATSVTRLGMVFRNENGSQEFKDDECADFIFKLGSFQVDLIKPAQQLTIVESGSRIDIEALATVVEHYILYANDVEIYTVSGQKEFLLNTTIVENTNFRLVAILLQDTMEIHFQVVVRPDVQIEDLPEGLEDGLTPYDTDHAYSWVLYAPEKSFVHLIGDFNNWEISDDYLMKWDSAQNRFWLTKEFVDPTLEIQYQYLVDYTHRIADPYSQLILDEFNDGFITEEIFSELPDYPSEFTEHAVTYYNKSLFDYNWNITDFEPVENVNLIIYELLIRDFDERHSFEAVIDRLDYLENLGVNAIELMPISEFDGNESWGYNPSFHMALDKYYGTPRNFKRLVDACHERGMAVILDVVYNHATGQNPYFRLWNTSNGGYDGVATDDNPFFNPTATHNYSVFNDYDHSSEATNAYVKRTAQYWIEEFNVDGFRWDLTKGFTQNCLDNANNCTDNPQEDRIEVLKAYADYQWEADDDFIVIFEHLGQIEEEKQWAEYRRDENKGIMLWNKMTDPYNETTMGYHENGKSELSNIIAANKGFRNRDATVSYMESHDEQRLMYKNLQFGNSKGDYDVKNLPTALQRMEAISPFFFFHPGAKMIWQFGELGYDVDINFNGRVGNKPILWEYFEDPNRRQVYDTWSKIIELRTTQHILTGETITFASKGGEVKTIQFEGEQEEPDQLNKISAIGNFTMDTTTATLSFREPTNWYDLFDNNTLTQQDVRSITVTLAPGEFKVFGDKPLDIFTSVKHQINANSTISVFPNVLSASNDYLTLTGVEHSKIRIVIYDQLGKSVYSGNYMSNTAIGQLKIQNPLTEAGIYFLAVHDGNNSTAVKLIVQ